MDYQEKILISLIETWNDNNPKERLNQDLIKLIDKTIGYAFAVGSEQMSKKITKRLNLIADIHEMVQLEVAINIVKAL